jgi:hypothetical protein
MKDHEALLQQAMKDSGPLAEDIRWHLIHMMKAARRDDRYDLALHGQKACVI